MRTLPPGTILGPYVLEAELARGGMGAVYRARRSQDGGVVALKLLTAGPGATPEQRLRFQREGELAARLDHPGIVRVHDAGAVSGLSYLAMDLIEGEPLGACAGRLAPLEAARLVGQVARAIEYAHAHGVVHRDLKPSNVLVRKDDGRAVVTDFGIARDLESAAMTRSGALMGTPTYLSPEQAAGQKATPASDVHALGALLFELLTGVPPFRQDDLPSLLVAIERERPERPSALARGTPAALDRVCLAALEKDPARRPAAGAFAAELEGVVAGRRVGSSRRGLLVVGALALVAATGLVAAMRVAPPTPPASTSATPAAPARLTGVATGVATEGPPAAPARVSGWQATFAAPMSFEVMSSDEGDGGVEDARTVFALTISTGAADVVGARATVPMRLTRIRMRAAALQGDLDTADAAGDAFVLTLDGVRALLDAALAASLRVTLDPRTGEVTSVTGMPNAALGSVSPLAAELPGILSDDSVVSLLGSVLHVFPEDPGDESLVATTWIQPAIGFRGARAARREADGRLSFSGTPTRLQVRQGYVLRASAVLVATRVAGEVVFDGERVVSSTTRLEYDDDQGPQRRTFRFRVLR